MKMVYLEHYKSVFVVFVCGFLFENFDAAANDPVVGKNAERFNVPEEKEAKFSGFNRRLAEEVSSQIRATCVSSNVKCREQSAEAKSLKVAIRDIRLAETRKRQGNSSAEAAIQKEANELLSRVQMAKLRTFSAAGLTPNIVVPADTGLWQGDILLTKQQADYLIHSPDDPSVIPDIPTNSTAASGEERRRRRRRRFAAQFPLSLWPSRNIAYSFGNSTTGDQRELTKSALEEIESKTCLRFKEELENSTTDVRIEFNILQSKNTALLCGLSYLGKLERVNPVYINFACNDSYGTVIHETLHALGMHHEEARPDRNEWLSIQWQNINPQVLDFFYVIDASQANTFALPFDYFSVMHNNAGFGSVNGRSSLTPTQKPVEYFQQAIGSRKHLSSLDAALLNKMYCQAECQDYHVLCGYWASDSYCDATNGYFEFMEQTCKLSCNFC